MSFGSTVRKIVNYFCQRGIEPGESLSDAVLTGERSESVSRSDKHGQWRVACSCGFERQAATAWEATELARLHVRAILGDLEQDHTWTIEEPPSRRA